MFITCCQSYLSTEHDTDDDDEDDDVDDDEDDDVDDDDDEVDDVDNLEDSVNPVGDDGGTRKAAFHLCRHTHQFVDLGICCYLYMYLQLYL